MAAAQPLTTLSGAPASRLAIGGGPETTQLEPGLLPAARAAGVSFLYWASGDKSPAFAQAFKELAASPSRPELFIAANCRTSPEFVREDVTATLRELELDVLDAVVVQYILPEEDGDKVQAALEAAQQLKAEGLVRHVAASTHSFDLGAALVLRDARRDHAALQHGAPHGRVSALRHCSSGARRAAATRPVSGARTVDCTACVPSLSVACPFSAQHPRRYAFPTALANGVPVFSFTSTRWNTLQGGHRKWTGQLPNTGDCIGAETGPRCFSKFPVTFIPSLSLQSTICFPPGKVAHQKAALF